MAGMGGSGKGGGGGGNMGGGNPAAFFANQPGTGMYGVDPSADPQFVDASVLSDPLSGVQAALAGGPTDYSSFFPGGGQGPQAADVGGQQSDPNAPTQQGGAQAAAGSVGGDQSVLSKLAQTINPVSSAHAEAAVGPHWFEGGKGDREDRLPDTASAPLTYQGLKTGPYRDQPYSPPIQGGTAPVPGADAAPVVTSRIPGPAPGMPQAPQEPQPAAVEARPQKEDYTKIAQPPLAPPPGGAIPQDPIGALFHMLGLDQLIQQVGGNYDPANQQRRQQQYGLSDILRRAGNVGNVLAGRPTVPQQQQRQQQPRQDGTRYVNKPSGMMPEANPHYGATQPPQHTATSTGGGGGAYNPQTYTRAVAGIESGGNPRNVTGSNVGLFSMGPQEIREFGDPNDPHSLARETAKNTNALRHALGRDPAPWELYLTHQQGIAGGPALLTANPNMPAWQAVRRFYKSEAIAKSAIKGNAKWGELANVPAEDITAGMFTKWWQGRFNRELARGKGGGTRVASERPPLPDAQRGRHGHWYVKRGGRYYRVVEDAQNAQA